MTRPLERHLEIERSIVKKYRKALWNPFIRAVKRYSLIQEGDKIAVCISGGKDSMLLAKLMELLKRYGEQQFELVFLAMDPGYNEKNRARILENAETLKIPLTMFSSDIFAAADSVENSPCYLCARMRRGHLYAKAKELGCNKIALGHHLNDVIETTLIGMFYGAQLQGMMPKIRSQNFEGMELIRPLYCVKEDDIIAWARYNGLEFIRCACRVTARTEAEEGCSKRQEMKELVNALKRQDAQIEDNLFTALHAVCLDTFPGLKADGKTYSFDELYKKKADKKTDR